MSDRRRMMLENRGGVDNNGLIRDSLEKFIRICKSGEAPNRYSMYNYITVPYGTDRTIDLEIVKFNESGTNVTLVAKQCPPESKDVDKDGGTEYGSSHRYSGYLKGGTNGQNSSRVLFESTMYNALPQILRDAIVSISRTYSHIDNHGDGFRYYSTTSFTANLKIWPVPIGVISSYYSYSDNERRKRTLQGTNTPVIWMLSDITNSEHWTRTYILEDGSFLYEYPGTDTVQYCTFGICL